MDILNRKIFVFLHIPTNSNISIKSTSELDALLEIKQEFRHQFKFLKVINKTSFKNK